MFKLIPTALLAAPLWWNGGPPVMAGSIQDVRHVVILMQENRSFDHYFGTMRGVRGFNDPNILLFQNGNSDLFQPAGGTNFDLPIAVTNICTSDVDHSEDGGLEAANNGWWNGWPLAKGPGTLGYYDSTNFPFYRSLADAYTICDNNFCSFTGPTFPNRIYLFTGTVDPAGMGGGPALGNDVPAGGYTWTTYPERLQAAGVSWRVYRSAGDWFGDALQWFSPYQNASPGNPLYDRGLATVNDVVSAFAADVTNGTLPQVSWIIPPNLGWSEHPPYDINWGEELVHELLSAIAANPAVYQSTVFILTYDENGGFFDHIPPPTPPPGTTNEFVSGSPLGLGVRVPMFIVSPWTRGGRVCSHVFDHTSIIRFLETWTGVQEPNISAWRRQTCGDLTSAFNFATPDPSLPLLPATHFGNNVVPEWPTPPAAQYLPVQETGTRTACPLPYQPDANCTTDCNRNQISITMTNAGSAAVHFAIYPNAGRNDGPWQYDAPPGGSVSDSFAIPFAAGGEYDFTCYGPNGFQRRFAGNLDQDCQQIETTSRIDPVGGSLTLGLTNSAAILVNFTIIDNLNSGISCHYALPSGTSTKGAFPVVVSNNGWYDLTVSADADASFVRHFAGHLENGMFSVSQAPLIVGNPLQITTNPPIILPPPPTGSITDTIDNFIALNSPATAGTNSLILSVCAYETNCMLIYPAWASNYVVESSAVLAPAAWKQVNIAPTIVSNCNVVILPETTAASFFRLRH